LFLGTSIIDIFVEFVKVYGYLGAFTVSLVGSLVPFISGPYMIPVVALNPILNPTILGLVSALGASIGKLSSYLIGIWMGKYVLESRLRRKFEVTQKLLGKYGFPAIVLVSATPLPDDFVYIPMGMMRYSVWKTFTGILMGKTFLILLVTWSSFGILESIGAGESTSVVLGLISALVFVFLMIVYMKLNVEDWIEEKLLK
jgi:membrane protein YqaA with SNARE-associated domain